MSFVLDLDSAVQQVGTALVLTFHNLDFCCGVLHLVGEVVCPILYCILRLRRLNS